MQQVCRNFDAVIGPGIAIKSELKQARPVASPATQEPGQRVAPDEQSPARKQEPIPVTIYCDFTATQNQRPGKLTGRARLHLEGNFRQHTSAARPCGGSTDGCRDVTILEHKVALSRG